MASRKDRLSRRIRDEVEKNIARPEPGMSDFVDEVVSRREDAEQQEKPAQSEKTAETEGRFARFKRKKKSADRSSGSAAESGEDFRVSSEKKRETTYNITGDIRLEDYINAKEERPIWKKGIMYRWIGIGLLVLLVVGGLWTFIAWIFTPDYKLGIATVELTSQNIDDYVDTESLMPAPGQPIHIRFEWQPGSLDTDYLKIIIEKKEGARYRTEAELGRRPPRTANYLYFYGPLDPGDYRVEVWDRGGDVLEGKEIHIR